ncbi:MAG: hypothetical protein ABI217_07975 [Chthoniobacterales bacterium]
MDLSAASAFVMIVSENFAQYPIETQRSLLEGLYQLADECQEDLDELPDSPVNADLRTSLLLSKILISDAFKKGEFREGFRHAAQCFWPMVAPDFERCEHC